MIQNAKSEMSKLSLKAMEGRNGIDTEDRIPRKLKSLAYDLFGREECCLCGASSTLHLHHTAPEVKKLFRSHVAFKENGELANDLDPYRNTEPWQLVPICPSCHRKIENTNFSLMNWTLWWLALKKAGEYEAELETYLEERSLDIAEHRRTPLNSDFWTAGNTEAQAEKTS